MGQLSPVERQEYEHIRRRDYLLIQYKVKRECYVLNAVVLLEAVHLA